MQLGKTYNPDFMTDNEHENMTQRALCATSKKRILCLLTKYWIEKSMDLEPTHLMRQLGLHRVFVFNLID